MLSTNVMMRAREFAILKSVGMTTKGLQKLRRQNLIESIRMKTE